MRSSTIRTIYLLILALITGIPLSGFAQEKLNVDLLDNALRSDLRYSGSWYYEKNGVEYALIGAFSGTAIYEISAAGELNEVGFITGPGSNWREITVFGDFAYVTTEGTDSIPTGLQVIDLRQLPDTAYLLANYNSTFTLGHIVQRDIYSQEPYIYVIGTQSTEGIHIIDVSNPEFPEEIGLYAPGYYIHDAHINGDFLYACSTDENQVDIIDISDKTNPKFVVSIEDPGVNTHSCWLTEDKSHLFLCNEMDGLPGRIFNIEDLEDIYEVSTYTANLESLVHNPYIRGDFAFISHNTEGLRVVDIKDPSLPVEVGFYDTFDGASGGFSGLWSACPFLPSKRIIGGDRTRGLFVWEFNEVRAARIYGTVIDSLSGEPVAAASIEIEGDSEVLSSDNMGKFKYGSYPQEIKLNISASNYLEKEIEIDLSSGIEIELVIALSPQISGQSAGIDMEKIQFFPNPVASSVTIKVPSKFVGKEVELIRADGSIARRDKIYFELFRMPLPLENSGTYFIQIKNKKGQTVAREKLIRQ